MAALSLVRMWGEAPDDDRPHPRPNANDWLTLEQAACELGVSVSTVRRKLRRGELRNRIVPRKGGFAYRIYIPDSRHGNNPGLCGKEGPHERTATRLAPAEPQPPERRTLPHDLDAYRRHRAALAEEEAREEKDGALRVLEERVARITEALRPRPQAALATACIGRDPNDPYARYRQLVRRRRWWKF
jgi:excisionase family DNA binding protein